MEPASIGLCFGLLNVTATLAIKVGQLIAELENAGDEFDDIMQQFTVTSSTLFHLKNLFTNTSLPPSLVSEYTRQVQKYQNSLDDIEKTLTQILKNLNSKSFMKRFAQKRDLADGDIRRLTSKILSFNTNLNLMVTTYSCTVIGLVHDGVSRVEGGVSRVEEGVSRVENGVSRVEDGVTKVESGVDRVESGIRRVESRAPVTQGMRVDINFQYVEAARRAQQEDWDRVHAGESSWGANTTNPPRYEDIQPAASTNTSTGVGGLSFAQSSKPKLPPRLPPRSPPPTVKVQDDENLPEPVPITDMNRYLPDPRPQSKFALRTQVEEVQRTPTPSLGKRMSSYFFNPKPQPEFPPDSKGIQDEDSRSVIHTGGYGLGAVQQDLSGAQRIQDEEWRAWEQKRREARTIYEM